MSLKQKNSFLFFCLIMSLILTSLGFWQVQRLEWKTGLIKKIEQRLSLPPVLLKDLPSEDQDLSFYPVYAEPLFLFHYAKKLVPRMYEGKQGHHIVIPTLLNDQQVLFVNWGFADHDIDTNRPTEKIGVHGYLRDFPKKNIFTPESDWSAKEIYALDPAALLKEYHLKDKTVFPYMLYSTSYQTTNNLTPHKALITLPNNHLSYAIFWFIMALIIMSMGLFIRLRKVIKQ